MKRKQVRCCRKQHRHCRSRVRPRPSCAAGTLHRLRQQCTWVPAGGHDGHHGGVCGREHRRPDCHHHPSPQSRGAADRVAQPAGHVRLHVTSQLLPMHKRGSMQTASARLPLTGQMLDTNWIRSGTESQRARWQPLPSRHLRPRSLANRALSRCSACHLYTPQQFNSKPLECRCEHALLQACGADMCCNMMSCCRVPGRPNSHGQQQMLRVPLRSRCRACPCTLATTVSLL